ncbi:hypothetical protein Pelo_9570 [Pelomyxa schiedti]|nr:hypothetical protein Pelo_17304 [Pelomyxa schiedti]KAH3758659.1 hypothetical protein Pelo_9570 [Pelomyxa schiedti]
MIRHNYGSSLELHFEEIGGAPLLDSILSTLRLGEAMFPIVGLCCRRVTSTFQRRLCLSHYRFIGIAALAGAPACVAWLVKSHRKTRMETMPKSPSGVDARIYDDSGHGHCDDEPEQWARGVTVKEVMWVMSGLCRAGNVRMLRAMFGGQRGEEAERGSPSFPALWDGRLIPEWEQRGRNANLGADSGASDRIANPTTSPRDYMMQAPSSWIHSITKEACISGNLETVKWVVYTFLVTEESNEQWRQIGWFLTKGLTLALPRGHREIVEWLYDKLYLATGLRPPMCVLWQACEGKDPTIVKWLLEKGLDPRKWNIAPFVVQNKHSSVPLCKWLKDGKWWNCKSIKNTLRSVKNPDVAKWILTTFLKVSPDRNCVDHMCANLGVEFTKWVYRTVPFKATTDSFILACEHKSSIPLLQWLSARVSLLPSILIRALHRSLRFNHPETAEWLESTFHVMNQVNASDVVAGTILAKICNNPYCLDQVEGLKWFLDHLSRHSNISVTLVRKAIRLATENMGANGLELVLKAFPAQFSQLLRHPQRLSHEEDDGGESFPTSLLESMVVSFMSMGGLERLKWLLSTINQLSSPPLLTSDAVARVLNCDNYRFSHSCPTKVMKWLVIQFRLNASHIKRDFNCLLYRNLNWNNRSGVKWLVTSFGITSQEVLDMFDRWLPFIPRLYGLDLDTWNMLLAMFPPLDDVTVIRKHFMPILAQSAFIGRPTAARLGISIDEVRQYYGKNGRATTTPEVDHWLGETKYSC